MQFFKKLFDTDFMPHGHCYFWKPDVLWTNVSGDGIIVLAYFTIPFALYYFVKKRKDIEYKGMFLLFAAFIFFCGTTHLLDIISVWNPVYRLEGLLKLLTGIISIATAIILIKILPAALQIPTQKEMMLKTEKLEKANIYLEHFAHVSSHDLKSPLSSMKALITIMEDKQSVKEDSKKEFDLLKKLTNNLHNKVTALENIFILSKMHVLPKEAVELEQVLSEIKMLLADQIVLNNAIIISDFSEVKTLNFPHIHIRSVLKNLITNAIKYKQDNENPVINISTKKSGDKILLKISDNGLGIDLSLYGVKLFEMFRRFHDHVDGTGIGLHMVKSILDTYHASIEVTSEVNKGTTFYIYFEN
jgi:signal transduction histidine kinase